jgi:hypothetical protein
MKESKKLIKKSKHDIRFDTTRRSHWGVGTPKSSSLAEGRPENKEFDGGRAEFPNTLNTLFGTSPRDVRMLLFKLETNSQEAWWSRKQQKKKKKKKKTFDN